MMVLKSESRQFTLWLALALAYLFGPLPVFRAQENAPQSPAPGAMLDQGLVTLETPDFHLSLVRSSQTIARLRPREAPDFDFAPSDLLNQRSPNGYFHLGDLTLRLRRGDSRTWMNYSTAAS